jgi:hypothetical protein
MPLIKPSSIAADLERFAAEVRAGTLKQFVFTWDGESPLEVVFASAMVQEADGAE